MINATFAAGERRNTLPLSEVTANLGSRNTPKASNDWLASARTDILSFDATYTVKIGFVKNKMKLFFRLPPCLR